MLILGLPGVKQGSRTNSTWVFYICFCCKTYQPQTLKKTNVAFSCVFIISNGRAGGRCAPNHMFYCAAAHTQRVQNSGRFLNFKNVLNSLEKVGAKIGVESFAGDVWQKMRHLGSAKLHFEATGRAPENRKSIVFIWKYIDFSDMHRHNSTLRWPQAGCEKGTVCVLLLL